MEQLTVAHPPQAKRIPVLPMALYADADNSAVGITAPIVIGYIAKSTGSFNSALVYVGANPLAAVISFLVLMKQIKRVQLKLI